MSAFSAMAALIVPPVCLCASTSNSASVHTSLILGQFALSSSNFICCGWLEMKAVTASLSCIVSGVSGNACLAKHVALAPTCRMFSSLFCWSVFSSCTLRFAMSRVPRFLSRCALTSRLVLRSSLAGALPGWIRSTDPLTRNECSPVASLRIGPLLPGVSFSERTDHKGTTRRSDTNWLVVA